MHTNCTREHINNTNKNNSYIFQYLGYKQICLLNENQIKFISMKITRFAKKNLIKD